MPVTFQRSGVVRFLGKNLILFAGAFLIASVAVDAVSKFGAAFAPMTARARQAPEAYTIIKDENVGNETRSVDVLLEHAISEELLELFAKRILSMKGPLTDRTLISYHVRWYPGSTSAWATTHFDPDLQVRIIPPDESAATSGVLPRNGDIATTTEVVQVVQ